MPSKKKKYNARFPPARIKKIMQSDEEVGKVAQAVPVIISRALELFVENLLKKAETVTHARNAKTLTPSHLKQCIMAEQRFDFLKDVVSAIPDVQGDEESAETPRSAVSNTSFVFPVSTATSSSSSASSTSTGAAAGSSESPTIPSYAPIPPHPDQNVNYTGHEGVNHALRGIPPSFPPRSTQSTMNSSVPVIVRNPGVIQLQQNSMMNPGVNSYIPNVSEPGTSGGPYSTMYHQHQMNNPNGAEAQYDGGVNKQIHPYGVGQTDGSLGSANSGMHSSSLMYDHKSPTMNSYQYHHSNQYHSQ